MRIIDEAILNELNERGDTTSKLLPTLGALAATGVLGYLAYRTLLPPPPPSASTKTAGGPATGKLTGGLLVKACRDSDQFSQIKSQIFWKEVDVPALDLTITVAKDALRCNVNGESLRMPVTYNEQIEICNKLGCISPTTEMVDAIWASSKQIPTYQLNVTPGSSYDVHLDLVKNFVEAAGVRPWKDQKLVLLMQSLVMSQQLNANVDRAALEKGYDLAGDLIRSLGKNWVIDPAMTRNGAANYGWFKGDGTFEKWQGKYAGGVHNAEHYDYSQLFLDCPKLQAKQISTGDTVDLRDVYRQRMPHLKKYIDVYTG